MTRSIKSCLKGCVKQHPISLNVDCSVKPSKMQTLQKFISTASFKKSSAVHVQEPASPTHVEVLPARRVQEDMLSSETAGVKREEPIARWQSWDFSDPVYNIEKHPVCKSNSRKLTDLGAPHPVEYPAGQPSSPKEQQQQTASPPQAVH